MGNLTLGDLVSTGGNPAVTAFINRFLGKTEKPEPILVETAPDRYQWGSPVMLSESGDVIRASKVA